MPLLFHFSPFVDLLIFISMAVRSSSQPEAESKQQPSRLSQALTFFLIGTSLVVVIGLAFWAYQENYRTQAAQRETAALRHEIGDLRHRLAMLNAEWAYLNRPERLADLAALNFERLQLLPITREQFGEVAQVGYPRPRFDFSELTNPVEVQGQYSTAPAEGRP